MIKFKKLASVSLLLCGSSVLLGSLGGLIINSPIKSVNSNQGKVVSDDMTQKVQNFSDIKYQSSETAISFFAIIKDANGGADRLYAWGRNSLYLGLGHQTKSVVISPTLVPISKTGLYSIVKVVAGKSHTLLLTSDGEVWATGDNTYGQLGIGSNKNSNTFIKIDGSHFGSNPVTDIAVGIEHSLAIVGNNELYGWGVNYDGQFGNGKVEYDNITTPVKNELDIFKGKTLRSLQISGQTCGLLVDNILYLWGDNTYGQIGNGKNDGEFVVTPYNIDSRSVDFFELGITSFLKLENGLIYAWGDNSLNQTNIGVDSDEKIYVPTEITVYPTTTNASIIQILTFGKSVLAVAKDGSVYAAGDNTNGQLGIGSKLNETNGFVKLSKNFSSDVQLVASENTCFARDNSNNQLFAWGSSVLYGYSGESKSAPFETILFNGHESSNVITPMENNTNILASTAYNDIWNGNGTIYAERFEKYLVFNSLPTSSLGIVLFDNAPIYDDLSGSLVSDIYISKWFKGIDGVLYQSPSWDDKNDLFHINTSLYNFKKDSTTSITLKSNYKRDLMATDWENYVTIDGKINRTKLEEFLLLTDVPIDATFTVSEITTTRLGKISFIIKTDKIKNADGDQAITSRPFPISFNLNRPVSNIIPKTQSFQMSKDNFLKSLAIDENQQITSLNAFKSYVNITGYNVSAKYYMLGESEYVPATGLLKFKIWVSHYYDSASNLQSNGSATNPDSHYSLEFLINSESGSTLPPTNTPDQPFQWWWILIGIAIVGAGGFGLWHFKFRKKDNDKTGKDPKNKKAKKAATNTKDSKLKTDESKDLDKTTELPKTSENASKSEADAKTNDVPKNNVDNKSTDKLDAQSKSDTKDKTKGSKTSEKASKSEADAKTNDVPKNNVDNKSTDKLDAQSKSDTKDKTKGSKTSEKASKSEADAKTNDVPKNNVDNKSTDKLDAQSKSDTKDKK